MRISGLVGCALLVAAGKAGAIAAPPKRTLVINAPPSIPANGVLAVGTTDYLLGLATTQGTLESVMAGEEPVAGEGFTFTVPIGPEAMQTISVWRPEQPFAPGFFVATAGDEFGSPVPTEFAVVEGEAGPLELTVDSPQLGSEHVPKVQVPCGYTVGVYGETYPVVVATHYGFIPFLTFKLTSASSDTVLSQHFLRTFREPEQPQFLPIPFVNRELAVSMRFPAGEPEFCGMVEVLSLPDQQVTALDPVCVADDGTDWDQTVPATSDQIDAQLVHCTDPPPEFKPRYCALREAQLGEDLPECDVYTDEELEEALDTPIVVEGTPGEDPVEPSAEPTVEPSHEPTVEPSHEPTVEPSVEPGAEPEGAPVTGAPEPGPRDSSVPLEDEEDESDGPGGEANPSSRDEEDPEPSSRGDDAEDESSSSAARSTASGSDGGCAVNGGSPSSRGLWALSGLLLVALRRRSFTRRGPRTHGAPPPANREDARRDEPPARADDHDPQRLEQYAHQHDDGRDDERRDVRGVVVATDLALEALHPWGLPVTHARSPLRHWPLVKRPPSLPARRGL